MAGATECFPLGELLLDSCYGTSEPSTSDGITPVIGIPHVRDGVVRLNGLPRSNLSMSERERLALREGDLLFTRTNSHELVGQTGIVEVDTDAAFASYLVRLRVDRRRLDPHYLNYWMNSPAGRRQVGRIVTRAVGQANVNPTELRRSVRVPIPSLAEQRHIAGIIATWDMAILGSERLLEQKRRQQVARFVSLAAHHITLTSTIGELCEITKGGSLSKADINPRGARPCILYGELHTVYGRVGTVIRSRTDSTAGPATCAGDVLTPSSSETDVDLANATAVLQEGVFLGGDINVLRPRHPGVYDPSFLAYSIRHLWRKHVAALAQGQSVVHLYARDLARVRVALPSIDQQRAISALMAAAECEISVLERLAGAYRVQRDGLMQALFFEPRSVEVA